jgi:hypothetical protein
MFVFVRVPVSAFRGMQRSLGESNERHRLPIAIVSIGSNNGEAGAASHSSLQLVDRTEVGLADSSLPFYFNLST